MPLTDLERLLHLMVPLDPIEKNYAEWKSLKEKLEEELKHPVVWKHVGPKLASAVIKMDIRMEDLPFIDGKLDVVTFLKTWKRGIQICPTCNCIGNFHMPHIRKQYTKVETCSECGHL